MPSVPEIRDTKLRRRKEEDVLGKDIIDELRVQLMLKFRFLDLALWRMDLVPLRAGARYPMATDANEIIYDPPRVIARYRESFDESVRDYLHMILHCVFRHPFDKSHKNKEAWWLTCDMIVEGVAMDMCGDRFVSADDEARKLVLSEMRMLAGSLAPGKVYKLLLEAVLAPEGQAFRGITTDKINEWHALFERDNHEAWPANADSSEKSDQTEPGSTEEFSQNDENPDEGTQDKFLDTSGGENSDQSDNDDQDQEQQSMQAMLEQDVDDSQDGSDDMDDEPSDDSQDDGHDGTDEVGDQSDQGGKDETMDTDGDSTSGDDGLDDRGKDNQTDQSEQDWKDISEQIEMNLQTFSSEWGDQAGSLIANLHIANRKVVDYSEFLRKFMTLSEEMKINQDEFDYIYYTYGLDVYGNTPLIEPLEYMETHRVREFVIAIDTSESVSGPLVRKFLEHTFQILKESQDYTRDVNVHVIQCDAKVQADTKITDLRDVDKLMEGFYIRGFGGTDFRPVFDYVDSLKKRGELKDLKGLIYFTDGYGQFPEKMPEYETAFVFLDEGERETPKVPPWAMKVLIDEDGINRFKTTIVK